MACTQGTRTYTAYLPGGPPGKAQSARQVGLPPVTGFTARMLAFWLCEPFVAMTFQQPAGDSLKPGPPSSMVEKMAGAGG